ncbi:MAG: hypothetical protein RIN56_18645 [Sporomusaceae bacterium]|nr:hypothetical protein [Sporomusaceae bacterium]
MEANLIPFIYTAVFAAIVVTLVPRQEIRRLSIYGIIFGGAFDAIVVGAANLLGEFRYINYEPFGMLGIHFLAPVSWTLFFIIYFYHLPTKKVYIYMYTTMGIFYSMMFCQMLTKLGVLSLAHGIYDSIIPFIPWYIIATWGYLKLTKIDDSFASVNQMEHEHRQYFSPIYNPVAKPLPDQNEDGGDRPPKE